MKCCRPKRSPRISAASQPSSPNQRDNAPLGEAGLRLVIPGDKRGGRNVRDVFAIRVE
jgi:hypothetical protein